MNDKYKNTNAKQILTAKPDDKSSRHWLMMLGLLLAVFCGQALMTKAATYTVTNTNDSGPGSLRDAIAQANASPDNDTINFNLSGCPCIITLTSGELFIAGNGSLTINGLGAEQLSVSGNNQRRVFFILQDANASISGITVTGGFGDSGGAILNLGTLTLTNSTVSGNSASVDGGGIFNSITFPVDTTGLTLINTTVSNNMASRDGGGIYSYGRLILTNSTVSGNSASGGGGIYDNDAGNSTMTLTNSTVSNNSATFGAGIASYQSGFSIGNSIVAGNTGSSDVSGPFNSQGYNLIGNRDGSSGFGATGDQVGTSGSPINPLLGPLQDNGGPTETHALLPGSPAIDAGNSTLTTDQRGFTRPVDLAGYVNAGNGSDIGAFELQPIDSDNDGIPDTCDIDQNPGAVDFDRDGIVDSSTCDTQIGPPTNQNQCKNNGWRRFNFPRTFRNQGDCIQFVNTGR